MRRITLGAAAAVALALAPATALAQEEMMAMMPHPAHIHAGLCPEPGEVVAPLADVAVMLGDQVGPESAVPVESSTTSVPLALADIVASEHAINVHLSPADPGTYLACGDVGGSLVGGSELLLGLAPVGDSGYYGVAWLKDNGDSTTTVNVFLIYPSMGMMTEAEIDR